MKQFYTYDRRMTDSFEFVKRREGYLFASYWEPRQAYESAETVPKLVFMYDGKISLDVFKLEFELEMGVKWTSVAHMTLDWVPQDKPKAARIQLVHLELQYLKSWPHQIPWTDSALAEKWRYCNSCGVDTFKTQEHLEGCGFVSFGMQTWC